MSNEAKIKNRDKEKITQSNNDLDTIAFVEEKDKAIQKIDSSHLMIKDARYEIVEDHKEALDLEVLEQRYSDIFEKYDYMIGDISRNQLRLRGFYEDDNDSVPIDMKISSLEDYLAEYCSFGCPYFVLKRLAPKKNFKPYKKNKNSNRCKKSSHKKRSKKNSKQSNKHSSKNNKGKSTKSRNNNSQYNTKQKNSKQNFVKKERKDDSKRGSDKRKSKNVKTVKDDKGKEKFHIKRD